MFGQNTTIPGLTIPGNTWQEVGDSLVIQAAVIGDYGSPGHLAVHTRSWNVTLGTATSTTYVKSESLGQGQLQPDIFELSWALRPYA